MQKEKILVMYNLYYISEEKENYFNNNKINNDIVKYIINKNNNYDNYDNVEIRIKMENSCSIYKESNYNKSIRLLNIIYRCKDGAVSNDPPVTIIGLKVPPSMILENILFQVL